MRLNYKIKEIAEAVGGKLYGEFSQVTIQDVSLDSRSFSIGKNTLFFALVDKRDGHRFIQAAYDKGVRNFIVQKRIDPKAYPQACFVLVQDSRESLQTLAKYHRSKFQIPIIAVTGSNGKTIIKDWLHQLLSTQFNVLRNPKSYNSQIGVPLSVLELRKEHEIAVFEAGISQEKEMEKLESILQPNIALLANFGRAHRENFTSENLHLQEKIKLLKNAKITVHRKDHDVIHSVLSQQKATAGTAISWTSEANDSPISFQLKPTKQGACKVYVTFKEQQFDLLLNMQEEKMIENALHAITIALLSGVALEKLQMECPKLQNIEMRLQMKNGRYNSLLIEDYYNFDINSLQMALNYLGQQKGGRKTCVVLSGLPGDFQDRKTSEYQEISELLKASAVDELIAVGEQFQAHASLFPMLSKSFNSTAELIAKLNASHFRDKIILLKGSREFTFEKISSQFQDKQHRTVFEINLSAIEHNFNYYRRLLRPDTKIMVMVKALSYGSGTHEIAHLLSNLGVDYLGVAYTDEGVALRRSGVSTPIMVMNPSEHEFQTLHEHFLEPELYSIGILNKYTEYGNTCSITLPAHIKVDTGMHRLGFEENQIPHLLQILQESPQLQIKSVFSHLATSDDPKQSEFTKKQLASFDRVKDKFVAAGYDSVLFHTLNSSGITAYPEAQHNMVRLGLGLYGISPFKKHQQHLSPVGSLKTKITQIKSVNKGESIGYSHGEIAKEDMKIATISIGYADGLPRLAGQRNFQVKVKGQLRDIIGNVCMDMCMIDVTGLEVIANEEVVIFDDHHSINRLSKSCHTISYEILTGISSRVKRVYFQD